MKNIRERVWIFNEGAIGEWCMCYCKLNKVGTKDGCTWQSYDRSSGIFVRMWAEEYFITTRKLLEGSCVPLLVISYCDISESTYMWPEQQGVGVKRPRARGTVTGEDIISNQMAYERKLRDTEMVGAVILEDTRKVLRAFWRNKK